jgi:ribosomal protein S18 acetylase RimI-like enzyme
MTPLVLRLSRAGQVIVFPVPEIVDGVDYGIMKTPSIELATEEDREWCARLMAGSDPWITLRRNLEQCRKICQNREYLLYVARCNDRRCAFILLHQRGVAGSPYIASIATAEEGRGQGLGSTLLEFAENLFRAEAHHIFLCVSSFNLRARILYERHGYIALCELQDYVIDGASEILMHKWLRRT